MESNEDDAEGPSLPQGTKNYITVRGAERLQAEYKHLLNVERPEVVRTVAWAASNGDRSENADYIYGKRRLREIDRRLRFLLKRLDAAEIINPALQKADRVLFGATVTIQGEDGQNKVVRIVGVDEVEPSHGKISWVSPLGKALLQAKQGDVVLVRTPRGEEEYEVLQIQYEDF